MQKVLIQMLFVNSDRFEFSKIYKSFCKLVINDDSGKCVKLPVSGFQVRILLGQERPLSLGI